MNKLKLFLCVLACALLFGCVGVPESLKETESEPATTGNSPDDSLNLGDSAALPTVTAEPVERGDVDKIRAQLDIDLQKTYKNIKVEHARVGDGSVMPTIDVKIGGNPDFDFRTVVDYLYAGQFDVENESFYSTKRKGDPMDQNYPAWTEPTYYEAEGRVMSANALVYDWIGFEPSETDIFLATRSNSFGAIWGSETGPIAEGDNYSQYGHEITEIYELDYNRPAPSLSYKMTDGEEWNANEAISYVEDFWNTYLSLTDPIKYEYTVKTFIVVGLGNDKYGYIFRLQRKDRNGNYYDVETWYIRDDEAIENGEQFIIENDQMAWCTKKEVFTTYTKNYSFSLETETDAGDNLLTLGAAADILSEQLAPNIDLKLTAELNYVVACKGYPYYQIWKYPTYYQDVCLANCDIGIKPYWCFRTTDQCTAADPDYLEIYFVDALTGELRIMRNGVIQGW